MAVIDIRGGAVFTVDEIQFADDFTLEGSIEDQNLAVKRISSGQSRVFATKSDIDNLITALQKAKEVW